MKLSPRLSLSVFGLFCAVGLHPVRGVAPEASLAPAPAAATPVSTSRWEREIAAYEALDRLNPPAPGGMVFTGSSTVRLWKTLSADFPGKNVINRGFGGSQIADVVEFAERIVLPYKPAKVFLRSGGNDIHAGKAPERVFGDFKALVQKIHAAQPECEVVFISLCPAPVRWSEAEANKTLNQLVAAYAKATDKVGYIETYDMSLDASGQVREDLFVADRLHLNPEGYRLLAERVHAYVDRGAARVSAP